MALAALLLAILVAKGARADGGSTDASAPHGESSNDPTAWCQRRFQAPFAAFLGRGEGRAWSIEDVIDFDAGGGRQTIVDALHGSDVLVALVPDPVDSPLVYQFDQISHAVLSGVDRTGYLRDQTWLPWDDHHLDDSAALTADQACRRIVPGVRIFRPAHRATDAGANDGPARVVLFVGETPGEGVHKETLRHALFFAHDLQRADAPIRIVGPTFSGGARGLARTLDDVYGELPEGA
ncbi:MAG TPA: hypothetical protein VGI39_46095, partial [Polyangiaceae bacterium]